MYIWKIDKLTEELKTGIGDKEDFKYLFVYSLLGMSLLFNTFGGTVVDYIVTFITIIGSLAMLVYLYSVNGWENGKNYLSRYISTSVVVFFRSIVIVFIPLFITMAISAGVVWTYFDIKDGTLFIIPATVIYMAWVFYLQAKYFKAIQEKKNLD